MPRQRKQSKNSSKSPKKPPKTMHNDIELVDSNARSSGRKPSLKTSEYLEKKKRASMGLVQPKIKFS